MRYPTIESQISFSLFTVLSRSLVPPALSPPSASLIPVTPTEKPSNHNYTECCIALNVSYSCLGFCNIQSILDGTTGQDPEHCESDFQSIVKCMAGKCNVRFIFLCYINFTTIDTPEVHMSGVSGASV